MAMTTGAAKVLGNREKEWSAMYARISKLPVGQWPNLSISNPSGWYDDPLSPENWERQWRVYEDREQPTGKWQKPYKTQGEWTKWSRPKAGTALAEELAKQEKASSRNRFIKQIVEDDEDELGEEVEVPRKRASRAVAKVDLATLDSIDELEDDE